MVTREGCGAPVFSRAHHFQAPAMQAMYCLARNDVLSGVVIFLVLMRVVLLIYGEAETILE